MSNDYIKMAKDEDVARNIQNIISQLAAVARKTDIPTLAGASMPATPTQNEAAEAVKKIFAALGGTITPDTQNVEAE